MKRASYREAIAWIAHNDSRGDIGALDENAVRGQLTVGLVADLFGVDDGKVAADVVRKRQQLDDAEGRA